MNNIWQILIMSAVAAFFVTALLGPLTIPLLRRLKFGQQVRDDGPSTHLQKTGTPTMGGVMFVIGILAAGLWLGRHSGEALLVLGVMAGFGLVGFLDDFIKVALKRSLGLRAREKLLGQIIISALLAVVAVSYLGRGTDVVLPFSGFLNPGGISWEMGTWLYIIFAVTVVVGAANAVNFTDGLDGLAAGTTVTSAGALLLIALLVGRTGVSVVMAAVIGGCLGFLIYNRYPARVFMGDTGSLALGGALGAAAVVTRSELFLLLIGGVFVVEVLSVIIQVISFKTTGRRVFRMSPLHHHFELVGWSERRVVAVFWTAGAAFALLGLAGLYRLG